MTASMPGWMMVVDTAERAEERRDQVLLSAWRGTSISVAVFEVNDGGESEGEGVRAGELPKP